MTLFIVIVLTTGCNTFNADLERDNPNDPKAANFIQSNPEHFTVEIENGNIDIRWEDVSEYNSGYYVEKAIDDSSRYELVGKLPGDANYFRDSSKEIGLTVFYKVSSFDIKDGDEVVMYSETLEVSVQAIETYAGSSYDSNLINLSWTTEGQFSDGVIIQEKKQGQPEYRIVEQIDFSDQQLPTGTYEYRSDLETFNLDVRFTVFQYQEDVIVPIQCSDATYSINDPAGLNITFMNELEFQVEWDNSEDFADHYLLAVRHEQSGSVDRYELQPDEFSQTLDMEMKRGRSRYTLQGVSGNDQSGTLNIQKSFLVNVPMLTYSSTRLGAVTLKFEDYFEGPHMYSAIIVERAVNEGAFETIAELPANQSEYTDTDLQPFNIYSYRIRTLTTQGNEVIELISENRFVRVDEATISYSGPINTGNNVHFPDPNTLVFNKDNIYADGNAGVEVVDIDNLNERIEFESGHRFYRSRVSNSVDKIVEFVDGDSFGEYDLNIWDLNSKSLIRTISQAHIETGITNVNAILDFSRNSNLIASAVSNTQETEVKIWNTQTGNLLHTINISGERLSTLSFNPEKNEMVLSTDSDLYIYDTDTFQIIAHQEDVFSNYWYNYAMSGDGKRMYLYQYRRLKLFDLETKTFTGEKEYESGIRLLSANYDGSQLFIKEQDWSGIYDGDSFELIYRLKWDYNNSFDEVMMLNPQTIGSAFSIKRDPPPGPHTDLMKWESRDVWYMEPIRQ